MVFLRNLGVNLRDSLCDVLQYVSAQSLDFLDLAQKLSFLDWKPASVQKLFVDGHGLVSYFLKDLGDEPSDIGLTVEGIQFFEFPVAGV